MKGDALKELALLVCHLVKLRCHLDILVERYEALLQLRNQDQMELLYLDLASLWFMMNETVDLCYGVYDPTLN
jgi:hypothetical protein